MTTPGPPHDPSDPRPPVNPASSSPPPTPPPMPGGGATPPPMPGSVPPASPPTPPPGPSATPPTPPPGPSATPPMPPAATPPVPPTPSPTPPPSPASTPPVPTSPPPFSAPPGGPAAPGGPAGDPWGTPPPGGSAAPAPAKKKSNTKRTLLIILGVFVLLIGGCSYALWQFAGQLTGPIDAGNEWLAALDERDYQRASELSDPNCFERSDAAFYEETFGALDVESYNLSSTSFENDRGEASGTMTFVGEESRSVDLGLNDTDGWKICQFDIGPPGSGS